MKPERLVLIGAGGHCRSVIDTLIGSKAWNIVGILDMDPLARPLDGIPVIGTDEQIAQLAKQGSHFLITVGHMSAPPVARESLYRELLAHRAQLATVISPLAHKAMTSVLGQGSWVGHHAMIGPGSTCGVNVLINSGSLIEHDCVLGDHVHVATHTVLNGACIVGDGSFIGSGAIVKQGVRIGRNCMIGAGSVVLADVPDGITVVGVPSRPIRR